MDGLRERMGYPTAAGLPELREAIAGWAERRFGVMALDPATNVVPTLGSKEAIFSFAQVVLRPAAGKDTVVVTEPGLPRAGARARDRGGARRQPAPARGQRLPARPRRGGRGRLEPDRLFWVNYPNNPTCATAPLAFYERLAALARERTTSCSPPTDLRALVRAAASVLQVADLTNVAVFNSLSEALVDDGGTAPASSPATRP